MRIAILTHSTNPRGGVAHALELGEALGRIGHVAVVHAPDSGGGFFRPAACETVSVPAAPAPKDLFELLSLRRREYRAYFSRKPARAFDVFHAQDSISANALADLNLPFVRTVHHLDSFADARLMAAQARGVTAAEQHFVVSRQWREILRREYQVDADVVGNGVDCRRFSHVEDATDAALRARLGAGRPMLLAIGGIEERKNTLRLLQAFQAVRRRYAQAQLVIAGGASLLDHAGYGEAFHAARLEMGLGDAVRVIGPVAQADMPALYRAADALVFPSIKEGFGLVVLEAMASGLAVVTSRIAPFTEYLAERDVAWCDPYDVESISQAVLRALDPLARDELIARGDAVSAQHDWGRTAAAHLNIYEKMREMQHA